VRTSGKGILAATVVAVVAVAVVAGLILLGSPAQERMRKLDARRVSDLREAANAVDFHWTRHGCLPSSLEELSRKPGVHVKLLDPETEQPYEYRVLSGNTYELCAHFAHDTAEEHNALHKDFWSHGSGRYCFRLEVKSVKR